MARVYNNEAANCVSPARRGSQVSGIGSDLEGRLGRFLRVVVNWSCLSPCERKSHYVGNIDPAKYLDLTATCVSTMLDY